MEPASIRYKNPGAMWGGNAITKKWGEMGRVTLKDGLGQGNNIAVFPSFRNGIAAQVDLWRSARYRNKTVKAAITVWSGGNYVDSYISFLKSHAPGITADTVISDAMLGTSLGLAFLKAQAWHEAGKQYPANDTDWNGGRQMAMTGKPITTNNPQPKTATATAGTTGTGTVATAAQAAQSGWPWWAIVLVVLIGLGIAGFAAWWFHFRHEEVKTGGGQVLVPDEADLGRA